MSDQTPQETVERALAIAAGIKDVDGCVVLADESSSANVRWANNTLTTNGVTRGRRLTVIASVKGADGVAAGVVSRSSVRTADLDDLVRAAVAAASENTPAEDAGALVEPSRPADPTWHEQPQETSAAVFEGFVGDLGAALTKAAAQDRLLFGFAEHVVNSSFMGSSTDLRLRHDQPTGKLEMNAKSSDLTRSAWSGAATRDFTDIDIGRDADALAQRLKWATRRIDLPAARYETIVPPGALADLLIYMYWSAGARDAHDGRTVFSKPAGATRVGESLSSLPLTLRSDPSAPGLACIPFVVAHASSAESSVFDNGLDLSPTSWIDKGRLNSLIQTRHTAALTGLPVTPAIDNLIFEQDGATASLDDMIRSTERGLLLTCLWYIRSVDPQTLLLTGLTRDGVYLVEGGEVVGAVNNFRFNESPVDLLDRMTEVGSTQVCLCREWNDYFSRTAMPAVRIPDFNMSTVSKAS
ncbi:MAG TPA: metallopeptidase TldD-related protein [Acidothermaceae bacterium]